MAKQAIATLLSAMARALQISVLMLCILALGQAISFVHAKEAQSLSEDPVLEAEMMRIAENMRCLECQNETLAASHAGLASDLRAQIRRMLGEGQTEEQIIAFMVDRYGDFVLYKPPFKPTTWILWLGPFALLGVALFVLWRTIRRRNVNTFMPGLSAQQELEVQQLLSKSPKDSS